MASLKIVSALNLNSDQLNYLLISFQEKKEHPDLCKIQSKPLIVIIKDNFEEKKSSQIRRAVVYNAKDTK